MKKNSQKNKKIWLVKKKFQNLQKKVAVNLKKIDTS